MCFLKFLKQAPNKLRNYLVELAELAATQLPAACPRMLHIVIGNESCDLDSAVSALTLAFIYSKRHQQHDFVPVLNIPRNDYSLKTEVSYMLNLMGVSQQSLVFRDDLPLQLSSQFKFILVDHHVSPFQRNVVELIDHRPLENTSAMQLLPAECKCFIVPEVGSCATLVSERYYEDSEPRALDVDKLLHAAIVLDTINFSPVAKRFSARDIAMVERLELRMEVKNFSTYRQQLFENLVDARADINGLTVLKVLRKDLKVIQTELQSVQLVGLPMLVSQFIEKADVADAIQEFAAGNKLLIMLGMYMPPGDREQVQRDIGIISLTGQAQLAEHVRHALVYNQEPSFELKPKDINFMGGIYMMQQNVKATRKHLLPVIKAALLEWETKHDCDEVYFFKEKPKLGLS